MKAGQIRPVLEATQKVTLRALPSADMGREAGGFRRERGAPAPRGPTPTKQSEHCGQRRRSARGGTQKDVVALNESKVSRRSNEIDVRVRALRTELSPKILPLVLS
ncbi:MAG: hypothetical protein KatS3mg130_0757 [Candidatus Sumerlaea sp.]|nr:MAG: hypothetical protein KatS3mg130_0757 [Candidatus Sumerlaea sp.]